MSCSFCGHNVSLVEIQDETLFYKDHSITLKAMQKEVCSVCKEGTWDPESYKRYTEAQSELVQKTR